MRLPHATGLRIRQETAPGRVVELYPGTGLRSELALYVRDVWVTALQVLELAPTAPAACFSRERELWAVARGLTADLLLLDADLLVNVAHLQRVRAVILAGRLV
jgi:imidazolonepropionase-like amidohydrolase